jgi:putative ABC transport system permease protein
MIKNNILLALRLLSRKKNFSFIVILGLSTSIAVSILIVDYAQFELSYDTNFQNNNRIYRIQHTRFTNKEVISNRALSIPEVGIALKDYFPEIEQSTRLFPVSTNIEPVFNATSVSGGIRTFSEANAYAVDSTFCDVFALKFIYGNKETSLDGSDQVIISGSTALRYFNRLDVVGESLKGKIVDLVITGVFEDLPPNSHFKFDMLWSWFQMYGERSRYTYDGFYNYVLLKENANVDLLRQSLPEFTEGYMRDFYKDRPGSHSEFQLQPLTGIHLDSHIDGEMTVGGNRAVVNILLIVALLMIVIAVINHVNLNTSRSLERVKELFVRKVIGSTRLQLSLLFLTEALLICIIATGFGILLAWLLYPAFNTLFDSSISLFVMSQAYFWIATILFIIVASVLSGFAPAILLSSTRIQNDIKLSSTGTKFGFQTLLVTSQFAISFILVIGTWVLYKQVDFMQSKNPGFVMEQQLVMKLFPSHGEENDTTFHSKLTSMRNELSLNSLGASSTVSSSIPGRINEWRGSAGLSGAGDQSVIRTNLTRVDEEFLNTFGLTLVTGRNFNSTVNDQKNVIINEEAARAFGFTNPQEALGNHVDIMGSREIIGIVNSFHETGLKDEIVPSMFITGAGYMKFLTVSMPSENFHQQMTYVETIWKSHFPDKPFEYFFLDDFFNRQYQSDLIAGRGIGLFSGIAIIVACIGLFSLSVQTVHRRTKEIGIRKVLGASVMRITHELCSSFMTPVLLSTLFALPLSYYLAQLWLEQYSYKINITVMLFLAPSLMLIIVGICTVILQSAKAARKNPVECLKND